MFRQRTPALISSLFISLCTLIVLIVLHFMTGLNEPWIVIPVSVLLVFIASFFIITGLEDRYFYSKLRLIHSNVAKLRSPTARIAEKRIPDDRIIKEINRQLLGWEKDNREEIDHLKELEDYRKEFLGNISHELKTPIFTVQGYIHTLLDGGIEDHDINILYLKKAGLSIDRLIAIVDDLESISKLEAGELILEMRTFDFVELASEVIESLELRAAERNVKLEIDDITPKPIYVHADKDRIRQVLVNLLVNSIKYGKQDGTTSIIAEDHGDFISIDVRDDGLGIEKKHLSRLFERFYRVDKSRSRDQGGTGLGLAIVKHIMEAHEQDITVQSEVNKGTTFTFTLKKSK